MKTLSVFPVKGLLRAGWAATLSMPRPARGSTAAPPTNARLVMLRPDPLDSDVIVASFGSAFAERSPSTGARRFVSRRSEEHTSELQSLTTLVCRLLLAQQKSPTYA